MEAEGLHRRAVLPRAGAALRVPVQVGEVAEVQAVVLRSHRVRVPVRPVRVPPVRAHRVPALPVPARRVPVHRVPVPAPVRVPVQGLELRAVPVRLAQEGLEARAVLVEVPADRVVADQEVLAVAGREEAVPAVAGPGEEEVLAVVVRVEAQWGRNLEAGVAIRSVPRA